MSAAIDPDAFCISENTLNVLGKGFPTERYIKVGRMLVQNVQFFIYFCYKKLGLGPFDINLLLVVLIILKDLFDIIAGRLEGRNSLIFFNLPRTGIIGCQG